MEGVFKTIYIHLTHVYITDDVQETDLSIGRSKEYEEKLGAKQNIQFNKE